MSNKQIDPVYADELARASVTVDDLEAVAYSSVEQARQVKKDYIDIANNKDLQVDPNFYSLSRIDQMKASARHFVQFISHNDQKYNVNEVMSIKHLFVQYPYSFPSGVHQVMFVPCIRYLASEKQVKRWLPKVYSYEIVGCYCQTELGHGSDVQSLETTATFDMEAEQFVINSPTISSTKWWVGELGVWCTHAIVFAQLMLFGKNYGVHPFLVPIRDPKTRQPLPGVTVGDIGPKVAFSVKDNGFARFDKVRIPRDSMLMRYAKVSKAGIFSVPGNAKIGYAVMLQTRLTISCFFPRALTQALNIAIRYSIIRTQFPDAKGVERKILDYQTQQEKLLVPLAEIYGIILSGYKIENLNQDLLNRVAKDDFSTLNEMHIIVSGAKATWTESVLHHLEICRLACGGHGFSQYSGIPGLISEWKPMVTLEGENTVLHMQVARFLLKQYERAMKGKNLGFSCQYLKQMNDNSLSKLENVDSISDMNNIDVLRKILIANAVFSIQSAASKMLEHVSSGKSLKAAWDQHSGIELVEASKSHLNAFTMNNYVEFTHSQPKQNVRTLLGKLCTLYAVQKILERPTQLMEKEYLLPKHFTFLSEIRNQMLSAIRQDALVLVEAFGFQDSQLRSAIAMISGNPYETLYDWAKNKNELNDNYFAKGYEHIQKMQHVRSHL